MNEEQRKQAAADAAKANSPSQEKPEDVLANLQTERAEEINKKIEENSDKADILGDLAVALSLTKRLRNIVNSDLSLAEKIQAIKQLFEDNHVALDAVTKNLSAFPSPVQQFFQENLSPETTPQHTTTTAPNTQTPTATVTTSQTQQNEEIQKQQIQQQLDQKKAAETATAINQTPPQTWQNATPTARSHVTVDVSPTPAPTNFLTEERIKEAFGNKYKYESDGKTILLSDHKNKPAYSFEKTSASEYKMTNFNPINSTNDAKTMLEDLQKLFGKDIKVILQGGDPKQNAFLETAAKELGISIEKTASATETQALLQKSTPKPATNTFGNSAAIPKPPATTAKSPAAPSTSPLSTTPKPGIANKLEEEALHQVKYGLRK